MEDQHAYSVVFAVPTPHLTACFSFRTEVYVCRVEWRTGVLAFLELNGEKNHYKMLQQNILARVIDTNIRKANRTSCAVKTSAGRVGGRCPKPRVIIPRWVQTIITINIINNTR